MRPLTLTLSRAMTQATLAYTYAHIRRDNPRLPACKAIERAYREL